MSKTKIAIVQLTRIGDVIQTFQAAKQLKLDHPGTSLTLIARRDMAHGLDFLLSEVFDNIFYLDIRDFISHKDSKLKDCLGSISEYIEKINGLELDLLVNLSFNKSSSYLATLINAKNKMGIRRNEVNQLAIHDKWSQYVYSSIMNSTLNPFNLVDIFKYTLGAKTYEPSYVESPRENKIIVHPFASTRKKRWGTHKWVDLLHKALKDNPGFDLHIVGAKNDEQDALKLVEAPALQEFSHRIHNETGLNSIEQTHALLSRAKLLVCHDSMVSHLAAVTQTPTVVLSLGTVRPAETTPYQHNVLNIAPRRSCFPCQAETACELLPCHKDISHQMAGQIVSAILQEQTLDRSFFEKEVSPFYLNSVSVFAPHFSEMGMELIDITEAAQTADDAFKAFYRIIWSFYLRGVDAAYPLPNLSPESASTLYEHQKGCSNLFELYGFGMKYSKSIIEEAKKNEPKVSKIQEYIAKLSEVDQLASLTKGTYPHLKPIIDFFFVNKANASGNNIIEITESNLLSFHEARNLTQIMFDLINKTVGPSLQNSSVKDNSNDSKKDVEV